jgi:hypothetical protein
LHKAVHGLDSFLTVKLFVELFLRNDIFRFLSFKKRFLELAQEILNKNNIWLQGPVLKGRVNVYFKPIILEKYICNIHMSYTCPSPATFCIDCNDYVTAKRFRTFFNRTILYWFVIDFIEWIHFQNCSTQFYIKHTLVGYLMKLTLLSTIYLGSH